MNVPPDSTSVPPEQPASGDTDGLGEADEQELDDWFASDAAWKQSVQAQLDDMRGTMRGTAANNANQPSNAPRRQPRQGAARPLASGNAPASGGGGGGAGGAASTGQAPQSPDRPPQSGHWWYRDIGWLRRRGES